MKTFGGKVLRPIKNRYQRKTNIIVAREKKQTKAKKRNRRAAKAARKARKS
jgi:hypothetical protein